MTRDANHVLIYNISIIYEFEKSISCFVNFLNQNMVNQVFGMLLYPNLNTVSIPLTFFKTAIIRSISSLS